MSALSQISTGSLPELPGSTVLRMDMTGDHEVLRVDLGTPRETLFCRFMVNPTQVAGGEVVLAGGIDAQGRSVWQVTLDLTNELVTFHVGGVQMTSALPTSLAWHSVEVGLDTSTGLVSLRVNGVPRGTATAVFNATQHAWLGVGFISIGPTGTIDVDHWVLADSPIGVPRSTPADEHAGDPRRWLVVYNRSDAESCVWADTYRDRRGVPYANLCGLVLPTTETTSAGEYESMRQQIGDYLDDNGLRDQIVGVLLGYRVPGYADVAGTGSLTPIASYLHTDDAHGLPVVNPLYQSEITQRPIASEFVSVRLTGRIDAPTLAEAIALIDRADDLIANPLAHDQGADLLIDINPDSASISPGYTLPVQDWATGQGVAQLRLPTIVYDEQAPTTASNEAVIWGWRDAAPPAGFFETQGGRRAICLQFDPLPDPAVTVRDAAATDWLSAAMQAGYAYAAAPSRAYSLSSLPLPHLFFEGLRRGWTVAEAWLVAQPFLRDGLQLIGDPLMPIPFPQAGYDVFGPSPRLDLIDFDKPLAVLHAGVKQFAIDAEDLPAQGQAVRYLVRAIDAQGRSDHASATAYLAVDSGQVIRPALPAWPTDAEWLVLERAGQLVLSAYWPASLDALGIDMVQLVVQSGSDDPVTHSAVTPVTGQRRVVFTIDRPAEPTRYRFISVQGVTSFDSPWSAEVLPAGIPSQSLTLLEASS